jgi:hypothetical protein
MFMAFSDSLAQLIKRADLICETVMAAETHRCLTTYFPSVGLPARHQLNARRSVVARFLADRLRG